MGRIYSKYEVFAKQCKYCKNNEKGYCMVFNNPYDKWVNEPCEGFCLTYLDLIKQYHDTLMYAYKVEADDNVVYLIKKKLKTYIREYQKEIDSLTLSKYKKREKELCN